MNTRSRYERATQETAANLNVVVKSDSVQKLTKLSLPEIDAVVDLVAKVIPAGNVPGMILSGLTRISGRKVQPQKVKQDVNILIKEVLEQAKYTTFILGPAAIIWGYQNLLKLAGKDAESAFPEGIWQFYVDYALREDTARHASETNGFDSRLAQHKIQLTEIDRLTAWTMAAINCLHQYPDLLASEWYERTALWYLQEITGDPYLYQIWEKQKPYMRGADGSSYTYPEYRRIKFDQYLQGIIKNLQPSEKSAWETSVNDATENALADYQSQMSILAYLEPSPYGETRVPISLEQANIGIIHNGNYFLIPVCEPGTSSPADVRTVRYQISRLVSTHRKDDFPGFKPLASVKRSSLPTLYKRFTPALVSELEKLRFAPILINGDKTDASKSLTEIRQGERGVGDHALTIFDTGKTFVFDQSHIFFDGGWGAALAEIMTNEALSWAGYLNMLGPSILTKQSDYIELDPVIGVEDIQLIDQAPLISSEVGVENNKINIKACIDFRKFFKQRSDNVELTINDLLVLYRAIHAVTYQPSAGLRAEIDKLSQSNSAAADQIKQMLKNSSQIVPSILIPVDASKHIPRDRIYPLNMEVPLGGLDFLNLHKNALQAVIEYELAKEHNETNFDKFDLFQRQYIATLGGFGTILAKAKDIAVQGKSESVAAIKLLAHMPVPIKQLLDKIPSHYERLNNMWKGTEVISNLGAVAKNSSLTRFITAKDDNEQKRLAWGVMTDAKGVMHITLRDFRPHVATLEAISRKDLATMIAQEYLDSYVFGLNQFVQEITRIVIARPRRTPK